MKKKSTKNLRSKIVSLISSCFNNGDYHIQLDKFVYDSNGYCNGSVNIGGMSFRCSFNKDGYICWLVNLNHVLDDDESMIRKLCREVDEMIACNQEEVKKNRIKELEKELKLLKGE